MRPFDLFARVRAKTANTLVLIPVEEIIERTTSMNLIKAHWTETVGTKLPKGSVCYVIYDKNAKLYFTGLKQNTDCSSEIVIYRSRNLWYILFATCGQKTSGW